MIIDFSAFFVGVSKASYWVDGLPSGTMFKHRWNEDHDVARTSYFYRMMRVTLD